MKFFLNPLASTRGAALPEYAILALLVSTASISAVLGLSGSGSFPVLQVPATGTAASPPENCLSFSEGADSAAPKEEYTCYNLLGGPDRFDGGSDIRNLEVFTRDASRLAGSIQTGSGSDTIISSQNGTISTGSGDDEVLLDLTSHPLHSRYDISLGNGNDRATIKAGRPPEGAPANRLSPGPGGAIVTADCSHNPLTLSLQSFSSLEADGPCEYQVSASNMNSVRTILTSASGISGLFNAIEGLKFSAAGAYHGSAERSLAFSHSDNVDIDIDLSSAGPVALTFEEISAHGNEVDIRIASPDGFLSFLGAGGSSWDAEINHGAGGMVTFHVPESKTFAEQQFPRLTGRTGKLRIIGCFESIEALRKDGSTADLPSCETEQTSIPAAGEIALLRVTLAGQTEVIDLQNFVISQLQIQNS